MESGTLMFALPEGEGTIRVHVADVDGVVNGDFDQHKQRWRGALRMGSGQTIKLREDHSTVAGVIEGAKARWHEERRR